ncbi:hypothetical protein [Salmonella enterica]|uniref:hypothetical protein n=1 Tax=Salmonella enterica TaxID=28901 RepID=UPI002FFC75F5
MKKWKYRKGCENDFDGHNSAVLVVKSGHTGETYCLGRYYAGRIGEIKALGDIVVAYREPITDEQDLNDCIGAPEADNKYLHEIKPGIFVDVYDVLMAWNVTNPALQHLIKKALQAGDRGHKSREQDLQDIIDSAIRAKELEIK